MKKVLFVFLAAVLGASGCATVGGYGSLPAVVASNAALPYQILAAGQVGGMAPPYGYGAVPVCRLQDLQGLPAVSQPVLVRVPKSRGHRVADIVGAAAVVGGIAYINTGYDWRAGAVGAGTGAGGGLLWANHEPDSLCLYLPVPPPAKP